MLILALLFVIQFSIAISCLAVSPEQQRDFAEEGWTRVPTEVRAQVQDTFLCCGFNGTEPADPRLPCDRVQQQCCPFETACACPTCLSTLENTISYVFGLCGGIGLFFSFTEVCTE